MSTKTKRPVREGVSYLIESELERAELVLAAKSITDKLQGMAEDLAKVEADDIMPILDQLREVFGQQAADRFNSVATERVRSTIEALKAAKEGIGSEITRLEGGMGGDVPNDMAMGDDPAMAGDAALPPAPEGDVPPVDAELPATDGADAEVADADGDGVDDAALDAAFDDEGGSAAGRAKKESAAPKGNALSETKDPDGLVLAAFRNALNEGVAASVAARGVAVGFDIDVEDVIRIVREAARKRAVKESTISPQRKAELQKMGYGIAKGDDNKFFWSKADEKNATKPNAEPQKQDGVSNNENEAWADLDAFVGKGNKLGQKPAFAESEAKATSAWKVIAEDARKVLATKPKLTLEQVVQALIRKHGMSLAEAGNAYRAVVQRVMAESKKGKKPDADKDGVPNWADKNPFKKGEAKKERKVDEGKKHPFDHGQRVADKDGAAQKTAAKVAEAKKDGDPCWTGYEQVGMKKKGGKEVPNCVPKKKVDEDRGQTMLNVISSTPSEMEVVAGRLVARHLRKAIERLKFDGHDVKSFEDGNLLQVKFTIRGPHAALTQLQRWLRQAQAQ